MDVLPEEEILPSWSKLLDHFGLEVLVMITANHQQMQTLPTEKLMDLLTWWLFFWATEATQAYKAEWVQILALLLTSCMPRRFMSFLSLVSSSVSSRGPPPGACEGPPRGNYCWCSLARCSQQRSDTLLPLPSAGAGLTHTSHVWAHCMKQGPHMAMSSHRVQCCHVLSARPKCGDCSWASGFDIKYVCLCRSHPSSFT